MIGNRIITIALLFFTSYNINAQIVKDVHTGILGFEFYAGRNSEYGNGGLLVLIRPVNALELTGGLVAGGGNEGGGLEAGINFFPLSYKWDISKKSWFGPVFMNPYAAFSFSSYHDVNYVREYAGGETSYRNPGNNFLALSVNLKVELITLSGHKIEDHGFLDFGISYRYSLTNRSVYYTGGYFDQLNVDEINRRVSFPFGFHLGAGLYIKKILAVRKLLPM